MSWLSDAVDWVGENISDAYDYVSDAVSDAYDWAVDNISDVADSVWEGIKDVADAVADGVSEAYDWVSDNVSDAYNWVSDKVDDGYKEVKSWFSEEAKTPPPITNAIVKKDGIKGLTDSIKSSNNPVNMAQRSSNKNRDFLDKLNNWEELSLKKFNMPEQKLIFDGKGLVFLKDGEIKKYWVGVSGNDNFQNSKYQYLKNKGPIPEGEYFISSDVQKISSGENLLGYASSALNSISGYKFGSWTGGKYSWGNGRVWLEPKAQTDTFGRTGFSIHGGAVPGSAGCIDLTDQIDDFIKYFEKNNLKNISLEVKY